MHRNSNPANLTAGFLNINSIRNKFSALQHILCNAYVDLMGVSETKLDDTFPHGQFHVDNHVLSRKDRTSHGGGVALYVRSDIPHRRRHDLENIIDRSATGLEIIIMEVTMRRKDRWIYVVGYKPPGMISSVLCVIWFYQNVKILQFLVIITVISWLIPPERYMWNFWFTKSHIWSDLFQKTKWKFDWPLFGIKSIAI